MGVTGLWQLIDSCGKVVPLETLENKVLAVDISIWLHQVVKGYQDNKGSVLANAHLLGLFHRLCKLLYYRIRPVFIFDGGVPHLKRETIAKRNQSRNKLVSEADRLQRLLLESLAKEKVVQQALGPNAAEILKSPTKPNVPTKPEKDDLFKLPDLPLSQQSNVSVSQDSSFTCDSTSESDSSFDDNRLAYYMNNLQAIDVNSVNFKSLPADIRHDILTDIKETRKQSSWGKLHELPVESNDFSTFQMKRLLKRRQVQVSLEEAEQQMGGKSLTINELRNFLTEEGVVAAAAGATAQRIISDENTKFLLVRDLKKEIKAEEKIQKEKLEAVAEVKEDEDIRKKLDVVNKIDLQTLDEKIIVTDELVDDFGEGPSGKHADDFLKEYDVDLQRAIQLSLESSAVYNDEDYDEGDVRMNRKQKQQLKTAAMSLARAYMIEYGGMNDDDLKNLFENTQQFDEDGGMIPHSFQHNDRFILKGEMCTPYKNWSKKSTEFVTATKTPSELTQKEPKSHQKPATEEKDSTVLVESDSEDSDFIDVPEVESLQETAKEEPLIETPKISDKKIEIVINMSEGFNTDEDMFADIFENEMEKGVKEVEEKIVTETTNKNEEEVVEIKSSQEEDKALAGNKLHKCEKNFNLTEMKEKDSEFNDCKIGEFSVFSNFGNLQKVARAGTSTVDTTDKISEKSNEPELLKSSKVKENLLEILVQLRGDLDNATKITLNDINVENDDLVQIINEEKKEKIQAKELIENLREDQIPKKLGEDKTPESDIATNATLSKRKTEIASKTHDVKKILEDLKKEAENVKNLSLDDIKIESSIVDITNSDTETSEAANKITSDTSIETIQILDEEDKQDPADLRTPGKSKKTIQDFFESQFVIKRTPEKQIDAKDANTSKVRSPFFVRKTPGSRESKRKVLNSREAASSSHNKVAKMLFDKPENEDDSNDVQKLIDAVPEDPVELAARVLRDNKSRDELKEIASELAHEKEEIQQERNRQDRMGSTITDKMNKDCMRLLRLFGIPYIVAPMEAEAQCAFLDTIQLTDGTITDDSDIWLFGGRSVYKNFFNQKKHVMEFKVGNIEKLFNVDRNKLIQLAILVGSDYTTGVHGIGAVTALEILATFPTTVAKEGEVTQTMSVLSSLRKFREWLKSGRTVGVGKTALRSKLKNIELSEGFPNFGVVEAYLNPTVDDNREKFSWGKPDVESIREFTKKNFGWTRTRTDEILTPVLKKMNDHKTQSSILKYFKSYSALSPKELKVSKRVQRAINQLSTNYKSDEDEPKTKKIRKPRTQKATSAESPEKSSGSTLAENSKKTRVKRKPKEATNGDDNVEVPQKASKKPVIPNPMQVIPQKEKDLLEMERRKKEAIELFKKSKNSM